MNRITLPLLAALWISIAGASPTVVGILPSAQSTSALKSTDIVVTFDVPIDTQTIVAANFSVFARWTGVVTGTFLFENGNTRVRFMPSKQFSAGEWVTVNLSKNIRSTDGQQMANGYAWNFWVKSGAGSLTLEEIARIPVRRPGEPRIQTYGAYAGDFNMDGWQDFAVPNELSNDIRMFLNNGAGGYDSFTIFPLPNGSVPSTNEGADYNGDGLMDFAVGNAGGDSVCVMIGDGTGGFTSLQNYAAAGGVRGLSVMDLDGDGDMDIVTANRAGNNVSILKNNGNGTFAPRINIEANGTQETACAAADANEDGILDLFVGAYGSNEIILLLGDGNGGLVYSHKVPAGGRPWMITAGDVNGDGHVDVVSANSQNNNAAVILGNGLGQLLPAVTYSTGLFPLAIELGDLDGDGDLDLVTSNYSSGTWTILENNGTGQFSNPRTLQASHAGSCATLHDRDNDGDLDMTGIDEIDDLLFLFRNGPAVGAAEALELSEAYSLAQNFPNPFNPITTISYTLPERTHASLKVFDLLGREVAVLKDEVMERGEWKVNFDATHVASGVYLYRLTAGTFTTSRKLVVMK